MATPRLQPAQECWTRAWWAEAEKKKERRRYRRRHSHQGRGGQDSLGLGVFSLLPTHRSNRAHVGKARGPVLLCGKVNRDTPHHDRRLLVQVGFMRDIYAHAERTYVVVSTPELPIPDAGRGAAAVRLVLKYLDEHLRTHGCMSYARAACEDGYSKIFRDSVRDHPKHIACDALPRAMEFVDHVASAKWWTRAWVGLGVFAAGLKRVIS